MCTKTQTQFFIFHEKIKIYHDDQIGEIKWFGKWRQYCFYPNGNTIWNVNCLNDVNSVITKLMEERKNAKI